MPKPVVTREDKEWMAKQNLNIALTNLFGDNTTAGVGFKVSGFTDALETYQKEMIRISEEYSGK